MKWDLRFLDLAKAVSLWSKDPSTKCGAVLVRHDRTIASVGYNGFPRGIDDNHRLNDRETKYECIIHAEMNAIMNCRDQTLIGYSIYVWPFLPCPNCAIHIIQSGIIKVVAPKNHKPDWAARLERSKRLLDEAHIDWTEYAVH